MNIFTRQAGRRRAVNAKDCVALAIASALSVVIVGTAFAADGGKRDEQRGRQQAHRVEPNHDRDRHGYVNGNYYAQPLYVPPVVVAVPVQSPGVNLFVPLDIHLR